MPKYGSNSVLFLVDGFNMLSAKLQSLRAKVEAYTEPTNGLGDGWRGATPVGVATAELAQDGAFFDTSTGNIHALLAGGVGNLTPQSVPRVVMTSFTGAIGTPFTGFEGVYAQGYEVLSEVEKLQRANTEYQVSGKAEDGVILHALTAETANANTEGASSVDNTTLPQRVVPITSSTAIGDVITCPVPHGLTTGDTVLIAGHAGSTPSINSEQTVTVLTPLTFSIATDVTVGGTGGTFTRGKTNNGGTGYLEMTALTLGGYTSVTVVHRHSDDDVTYADLLTFTTRTTIGAQRVAVAGAVRRHLAQSIAFVGAGSGASCTYATGFARAA
jgi:hypothetical protein